VFASPSQASPPAPARPPAPAPGLLHRLRAMLTGAPDPRTALRPLYAAVVAAQRRPHWYREGAVPDTIDGRFEVLALVLSLVLHRLEALGPEGIAASARLTEVFVDDMDAQLRQIGIGDIVVGKHVGRMMGAMGGRLGAYRGAVGGTLPLDAVLIRNLYRGEPPATRALDHAAADVRALWAGLQPRDLSSMLSGKELL